MPSCLPLRFGAHAPYTDTKPEREARRALSNEWCIDTLLMQQQQQHVEPLLLTDLRTETQSAHMQVRGGLVLLLVAQPDANDNNDTSDGVAHAAAIRNLLRTAHDCCFRVLYVPASATLEWWYDALRETLHAAQNGAASWHDYQFMQYALDVL